MSFAFARPARAAVLALGTLTIACHENAPEPAGPSLAAAVQSFTEEITADFTFNPGGCVQEDIALHVRERFRIQVVEAEGRRRIENIKTIEQGSYGVGVTTGTTYRLVGGSHETFSDGSNGTATLTAFNRYVSQGSGGNFTIRLHLHFTFTPEFGEPTSFIELFEAGC